MITEGKQKMKKEIKAFFTRQKVSGIAAIIAYAATGIALLIWPQMMAELALWALAGLLVCFGVIRLVKYLKTTPEEGAKGYALATALMALTLGVCILIDRTSFSQILPRLWGLWLLAGGFMKLQAGVDSYRLGSERWWWLLIGAGISLVLGALAALTPQFLENILARFIGASLVAEALIDAVALYLIRAKGKKAEQPAEKPKQDEK